MKELLVLAFVAAAGAVPCRAQNAFELPDALRGQVDDFHAARAAAPIDRGPVEELFDRLSQQWAGHDGSLTAMGPVLKDGTQEIVSVRLNEIEGPKGSGESAVVDLVYRRYFSNITAYSEVWKDLPGGEKRVVLWNFKIGLDGSILAAQQEVRVGKLVDPAKGSEGIKLDPKRSTVKNFRPKAPEAAAKWKELAPRLCALRPTVEA